MALTLLRHTRPAIEEGVCYGRLDLEPAETFIEEAAAVLERLGEVETIISSPLQRCFKLARHIAAARGLDVTTDERIVEMDFGNWEGQRWDDIPKPEVQQWLMDFLHARPHGGESVAMLRDRSLEALDDHGRNGASTLVVTHAGVIKSAFSDGDDANAFTTSIGFGETLVVP